jgi:PIN domain nuclease of toxin-antitoxin system
VRLLLDTHIVLWQLDDRPLATAANDAIDAADELLFSVVSFAEVGVKVATGKLAARPELRELVLAGGMQILNLSPEHGLAVGALPLHHRDPFDRLLIAQARAEGLTILTADGDFAHYDVPLVSALA